MVGECRFGLAQDSRVMVQDWSDADPAVFRQFFVAYLVGPHHTPDKKFERTPDARKDGNGTFRWGGYNDDCRFLPYPIS